MGPGAPALLSLAAELRQIRHLSGEMGSAPGLAIARSAGGDRGGGGVVSPKPPERRLPAVPARPQPERPGCTSGAGSKVRHGHRRAAPPGRVRLARGQRRPGHRSAGPSPRLGPGRGRRSSCEDPERCWGRPLGQATRGRRPFAASASARTALSSHRPPRFFQRGGRGDFLPGKRRGSFPGLLAPPQVSDPSPLLGIPGWAESGRRLQ